MVHIQDLTLFRAWLLTKLGFEKHDLADYICACLKNDGVTKSTLQAKLQDLLEDETQLHQLVIDVFAALESGSYIPASPASPSHLNVQPSPPPTAPLPIRPTSATSQASSVKPEHISLEPQTGFQSTESSARPVAARSSSSQPRGGDVRHPSRLARDPYNRDSRGSREPQDTRGYRREPYGSRGRRDDYPRDNYDRRNSSRRDSDRRRDSGPDRGGRRSMTLDEDDRDFRRQRRDGSDDEAETTGQPARSRVDQHVGKGDAPEPYNPEAPGMDRPLQQQQHHQQQRFNRNHNNARPWGPRGNGPMYPPPGMGFHPHGPPMMGHHPHMLIGPNGMPIPMGPNGPLFNPMGPGPGFMRPPMPVGGGGLRPPHPAQLEPSACLELTDVPPHLNARALIIKHFSQFGTVVGMNEGMDHRGHSKPDCAILEMASLEEAVAAFKSEESVLGNRFVNIHYTRRQPEPIPGVVRPVVAATEAALGETNTPSAEEQAPTETGDSAVLAPAPTQKIISRKEAMALEKQAQVNKLVEKENQRQQLLKASLAQQKQRIAQLEDASISAEEKASIMVKIQEGFKMIEVLKNKGKLTSVSKVVAKRAAKPTTVDPSPKRTPTGASRGRGRGRGSSRRATTTVLEVKGFAADEVDLLTPHFASIGHLVSVVPRGDSALVTFRDRRSGHEAINKACQFGDKSLAIDWYDPFAKRGVAPVVSLSRHDVIDEPEESEKAAETGETEPGEGVEGQEQAAPPTEVQQETETSQPAN